MSAAAETPLPVRPTRTRYKVLGFIVMAYMITYIDRVLLATAMPTIQEEFGFSLVTVGWILGSYQIAYALFQIPGGWLGDRIGPRLALTGVVIWWSCFTALTSFSWSAGSMAVCLFLIGLGEAGAFPIANRALSRWMLPSERAFSQGATHAGSRLGGAITPIIVVALIGAYSWRAPFVIFAAVGILWAVIWYRFYRDSPHEHPSVNEGERERIIAGLGHFKPGRRSVPWKQILRNPQLWLLSGMYFCYGYDIGIFLAWFPKYLVAERGFDLQQMGLFAGLPLAAGFIGDLTGGIVSDHLLKKTGNLKLARRSVSVVGFSIAAIMVPLAVFADDPMVSVALFCIAVFGLELTVGVSWAVTLDVGGEFAGSVSAVMNTLGNVGAALAAALTGYIVTVDGWDSAFYIIAGLAVTAALLTLTVDASRPLFRAERDDG